MLRQMHEKNRDAWIMLFCHVFVLLAQAAATGLKAGDLQRGQPHAANVRPCKDKEVGAKALTLHVHVHCVQIEVWHLILVMTFPLL